MVGITTLIGKNGLQTWLLQRITAVVIGLYLILILGFWFTHDVDFYAWKDFIQSVYGKPCALITLISILIHAWIGVWTVTTDYIKIFSIRLIVQISSIFALISYCYWGIKIIWL
jgi:succinate dehydrogenase / fumarate reductase membrane anchor subunit